MLGRIEGKGQSGKIDIPLSMVLMVESNERALQVTVYPFSQTALGKVRDSRTVMNTMFETK